MRLVTHITWTLLVLGYLGVSTGQLQADVQSRTITLFPSLVGGPAVYLPAGISIELGRASPPIACK